MVLLIRAYISLTEETSSALIQIESKVKYSRNKQFRWSSRQTHAFEHRSS